MRKETESSSWVHSIQAEIESMILSNSKECKNFMRIDAIILRELHMPLVRPFETSFGVTRNRRILLAEVQSEGLSGLGRMHGRRAPVFLRRIHRHRLAGPDSGAGPDAGRRIARAWRRLPAASSARVRGNRMAKATLENAIWDLEAQREGISLSRLLGGVRESIPCGVSLGIQSSIPELLVDHRARAGGRLPAHQAEVQAGLGCRSL